MSPSWYWQMFKQLVRYFLRHTRDRDSAPDLAQDALAAFHAAGPEKFEKPGAYLMTIARHLAYRKSSTEQWEKEHLQSLPPDDESLASPDSSQALDLVIREDVLQHAFSRLGEIDQRFLTLSLYDFDPEEIAAVTKRPVDHVRRRLRIARVLLEAHINTLRKGKNPW